jgi:non-canonical purine NTP pyrophosphatase (RdgB/HAM1 family)
MQNITFITGNAAKAEQLGRHLAHSITHTKLDLDEIQSLDLREIIEHKTREAYAQVGGVVLVEDASLTFNALGKLPGPLIKWFLTELNNDGLCKILDGYDDRSAVAEVCFGLYDGKELKIFEGHMDGSIATAPRGEKGFGWDPVFIPKGYEKTWGEMDVEEQKETSMRKIALEKLGEYISIMNTLKEKIKEYLNERGWNNLHPADIAKSIVIEGAELLEVFQWDNTANKKSIDAKQLENIKKELADIIIYSIEMGVILDLDLEKIVEDKLKKVKEKYPTKLFNKKNSTEKGTRELYSKIKQSYRKQGKN